MISFIGDMLSCLLRPERITADRFPVAGSILWLANDNRGRAMPLLIHQRWLFSWKILTTILERAGRSGYPLLLFMTDAALSAT